MKKIIAAILSILLISALGLNVFAMKEARLEIGDVNGVEGITAEDARLALRLALKIDDYKRIIDTYPTTCFDPEVASDVDGDGEVTAYDARLILRFCVGEITSFPASGTEDAHETPVADDREINFWNLWDGWRGVFDAELFRDLFNN
ncbi:MAG: hypothetical protein K6C36_01795 [Clostridia bacterium]|nr:hypothetical protein [Clostridia bacterium]